MTFRETITSKPFQLLKNPLSKLFLISFSHHSLYQLFVILAYQTLCFKSGHAPSQPICFCRRKSCSHDGNFHGLFLKQRYTKGSSQDFLQFLGSLFNECFTIHSPLTS